ncbi:hypothetical protein [Actinospica robiniae]|uniref:hypothetical protein n=1 Tax=Actinospica robiniae TaxID=304901 RepID=UPI00041AC9A4|nr:hypothetical protein [Actinospica robiniae]
MSGAEHEARRPGFPGGTGVSGLSVYRQAAPDALCGGSPHVHLACTAEFYHAAVALRADRYAAWETVWRKGALAAAQRTQGHLAELRRGRIEHLLGAGIGVETAGAPEARAFGMCGRLDRFSTQEL